MSNEYRRIYFSRHRKVINDSDNDDDGYDGNISSW